MYDRLLEAIRKLKETQDEMQLEFKDVKKQLDKDNNFYLQKLMRKVEEDLTNYTIQDGYWFFNGKNTGVKAEGLDGEDGATGPRGETGNGIEDISKKSSQGLVDTYIIKFSDGTFSTFDVKNGKDGKKGDTGKTGERGIAGRDGVDGKPGKDGKDGISPIIKIGKIEVSPEYGGANAKLRKGSKDNIFYLDLVLPRGPQGFTGFDGKDGEKGADGAPGKDGKGISNITKTSTSGLVDTYTITYTDNTTSTFTVTNGADGEVSQEELDQTNARVDSLDNTMPKLFDLAGNTYQAGTPTPDAPQDIEVVTGDNEIVICGKNLFDINTTIDGKCYESDGTIATYTNSFGKILEIQPNTIYSLSVQNNSSSSLRIYIFIFDKDMNRLHSLGWGDVITSNTKFVRENYKTPENAKYITISQDDAPTANKNDIQIMFEKGTTVSDYEPYKGNTYPINLGVKNLFNKDNANIINSYLVGTGNGVLPSDGGTENKCAYIPCKPNTTYTIQKMIGKRFGVAYTYETPAQGVTVYNRTIDNSAASITITTDSSAKYLVVYLRNGNVSGEITLQQALDTLQIEEGTKANSFSPYGQTPIELCKIGTYQDKFKFENGKWYLHKEIYKKVFDGTETLSSSGSSASRTILAYTVDENIEPYTRQTQIPNIISSHFISVSQQTTWVNGNVSRATNNTNGIFFILGGEYTSETGLQWLVNNNVITYTPLATPTDTQITDTTLINQLNAVHYAVTYGADTNVSQNNYEQPFEITYETIDNLSEYINGIIGAYITTTLEGVY